MKYADLHYGDEFFPHVRVAHSSVILTQGDQTVTLPGRWVRRESVVVNPGGRNDINTVSLVLCAAEVDVDDDAEVSVVRTSDSALADEQMLNREALMRGATLDSIAAVTTGCVD